MLTTYSRQGTTEASNRHRQKERKRKEKAAHPKPKNQKTCDLTLENVVARTNPPVAKHQGKKKITPPIPAVSATELEVGLRPQFSAQAKVGTIWIASSLFGMRGAE